MYKKGGRKECGETERAKIGQQDQLARARNSVYYMFVRASFSCPSFVGAFLCTGSILIIVSDCFRAF